jgi:hypothetical protein
MRYLFCRCVTLQVSQQSRHFIAEVVGDDLLQKEGGQALWQSIKYALEPGVIRCLSAPVVFCCQEGSNSPLHLLMCALEKWVLYRRAHQLAVCSSRSLRRGVF